MATNPVNPMGPLYRQLDRVLDEQRVHEQDILREAGPDVYTETDDGGAVTVVHDPQQESLFGDSELVSTADAPEIERLVRMIDENPAAFAIRYLGLERFCAIVRDRVETMENRVSILGSPNYVR